MKRLRHKLGMTQEAVAAAVGYSDRLVRKLERGGPVSHQTLGDFLQFYDGRLHRETESSGDAAGLRSTSEDDSSSMHESIARAWFERVFNRRDLAAINELFDEDVVLVAEGRVLRGRDEIRERVSSVLAGFEPLRFEIERIISQGPSVAAYWRVEKTHSGPFLGIEPTGRSVAIRGSSMAIFRARRIVEVRDHWDVDDLIRKLTGKAD